MAEAHLQRPTPSTLSEWSAFPTVNDPTAQLRLARAMGYPPGWRVIRTLITVPLAPSLAQSMASSSDAARVTTHPDGTYTIQAVQDRIYAGDPSTQPDGYYNHSAALLAASKYPWRPQYDDVIHDNNDDDFDDREFCSTSHKMRGGQLRGREAKFEEGDVVEVLYVEDEDDEEEEREWYEATITKRLEYEDDIRYAVHYHADDAEQSDVREEYIRATAKTKKKKAKTTKKKQTKASATTSNATSKRKGGRPKGSKNKNARSPVVEELTSDEIALAAEVGLPEGWGASRTQRKKGDYKWTLKSPDGRTFDSKKKAFAHAGLDAPESARGRKRKAPEEVDEEVIVDEGDPPWRTTDHPFLSRRVRWTPPEDNTELPHEPAEGTVLGWISETDVDSEGNPGFESSRTGQPAPLFHVVFDDFEQDFEEWELEEIFID